jgi:hypothetical protein
VTSLSGLLQPHSGEPEQELERAERLLLRAEREIRFLDRLVPKNLTSERERLLSQFSRGKASEPRFTYEAAAELERLLPFLNSLASTLLGAGPLGQLYAERARELEQEVSLLFALGRPAFRALASARYATEAYATEAETEAVCQDWLRVAPDSRPRSEGQVRADDQRDPRSLISVLQGRIGALRAPVRVEVRPGLSSVAAAGDGFVVIRPDALLSPAEALRIAHHELNAHVLPRLAARAETLGIFRVGARRASDEEEGRALLLEERAGLFPQERRRELALRHGAARLVHQGAPFAELVRWLEQRALSTPRALDVALRVSRGGGLGREVVYIPAYLRLKAEFARDARLERYFERGRVSLAAARTLLSLPRRAGELA